MTRLLADLAQTIKLWRSNMRQHKSIHSIKGVVYSGVLENASTENEQWTITVRISPFGDVFNVVKLTYADNTVMNRESWLSVYHNVCGGYLTEIGGPHYCFFNHAHKALYLEGSDGQSVDLTVLYQQNPEL